MGGKTSTLLVIFLSCAAGVAVWAGLRFTAPQFLPFGSSADISPVKSPPTAEMWEQAVAKVKEDRGELANTEPIQIPPELQHYTERRWFLATQVAEVRKHNLSTYRDFLDLASKLKSGELVEVPVVTESFVLFGVGQIADDRPFSRHENDRNVELFNEHELSAEFTRIDAARATMVADISSLNKQLAGLGRREKGKRTEIQKQLSAKQQELSSNDEHRKLLNELYGERASRDRLFRDYESLQTLAKDFRGRSYDLENPADRQTLKITLLSSLRPQTLKVLEQIATAYYQQFNRPLPVSSLVRPEQYQDSLRRVNRSATVIETPPHSTGLAFDIDYRYMGAAEQNFVMAELARLKQGGRIEVLRERSANYHVFVFLDGTRPSDDLVTASLDEIGPAPAPREVTETKPTRAKSNTKKSKPSRVRSKPRRRR